MAESGFTGASSEHCELMSKRQIFEEKQVPGLEAGKQRAQENENDSSHDRSRFRGASRKINSSDRLTGFSLPTRAPLPLHVKRDQAGRALHCRRHQARPPRRPGRNHPGSRCRTGGGVSQHLWRPAGDFFCSPTQAHPSMAAAITARLVALRPAAARAPEPQAQLPPPRRSRLQEGQQAAPSDSGSHPSAFEHFDSRTIANEMKKSQRQLTPRLPVHRVPLAQFASL